MGKKVTELDLMELLGYSLLGLIFVAMVVRSFEDFTDLETLAKIAGVLVIIGLFFGYRHLSVISDRLSAQQEGLIMICISFISLWILAAISGKSIQELDGKLLFAHVVVFAFGVVYLISSQIQLQLTRLEGVVSLLFGGAIIAMSLTQLQSRSILFLVNGVFFGALLAILGILTILRPNMIST